MPWAAWLRQSASLRRPASLRRRGSGRQSAAGPQQAPEAQRAGERQREASERQRAPQRRQARPQGPAGQERQRRGARQREQTRLPGPPAPRAARERASRRLAGSPPALGQRRDEAPRHRSNERVPFGAVATARRRARAGGRGGSLRQRHRPRDPARTLQVPMPERPRRSRQWAAASAARPLPALRSLRHAPPAPVPRPARALLRRSARDHLRRRAAVRGGWSRRPSRTGPRLEPAASRPVPSSSRAAPRQRPGRSRRRSPC